jgi:hypothetical protein
VLGVITLSEQTDFDGADDQQWRGYRRLKKRYIGLVLLSVLTVFVSRLSRF